SLCEPGDRAMWIVMYVAMIASLSAMGCCRWRSTGTNCRTMTRNRPTPGGDRASIACERELAYVPTGKAESTRALASRIRCGLRHRRKRSQELSGINCVAATIQLTGREPATLDCFVDRRFGDACGPCCAAWCVHSATSALR